MFFFLFYLFSRRFLDNQKTFGKTNNTKENQRQPTKPSAKPTKQSFKRFQTHPWKCFFCFCFFCFPEGFSKTKTTFGKPKDTKENQRKPKKPSPNQKTKLLKVSDPPLDMDLFFLFVRFSRRFFRFCWCSRRLVWFSKNLRENHTKKKRKKKWV